MIYQGFFFLGALSIDRPQFFECFFTVWTNTRKGNQASKLIYIEFLYGS